MAGSGQAGDVIRYTSCGYHCFNLCVLKVRIRDGVIVACEPDDTVNPGVAREDGCVPDRVIDTGMVQTRPCARGYAQARMIYDPNRLKYPMKRVGKRGEAKFTRISWDEALDTIAAKLVETKKNYGPYSIHHQPYSHFSSCSFPLAPWFGAGFAGWGAHSANGWTEPVNWVLGKRLEDGAQVGLDLSQDEVNIFKSKLIVLWGVNPLSNLGGSFAHNLLRAKERGIPIIAIEARYSQSVEVLADQWIPIRPTTDVAMMIAMANVWFKEELCDGHFIEKWVEPEGFQRWRAYVLGNEDGVDKNPEWAEVICGVPAETIAEFARLYARSKPVNLIVAWSIGRQCYGENPTRASMYLQALTGNSSIPGGTAAAETGMPRRRTPVPAPKVDWQRRPGDYKPPVLLAHYLWLKAIDKRSELDRGEISQEEYNNAIGNVAGNPSPNIQMIFMESNNHVNTLPNLNSNLRAMQKVDFVVVSSHYKENEAARHADILLPQIATAFEGRNCFCAAGSFDLFKSGFSLSNYFLYRQKCVEPVGEIKSTDWIWVQIAKRLGLAEQYQPRLANVPDEIWDETIEDIHREAYEQWTQRQDIVSFSPPDWDEFQKMPVFRYAIKDPAHAFKSAMAAGENPFSGTSSGKMEFYSKKLANGPSYLAANEFYPGKCYGGGNLPPMAQMVKGGKDTFHSDDARQFPLLMSSPHSTYRVHSYLDNNVDLKDCYRHAVWMNVADAKARGVVDDDLVRVFNDVGEMIITAYVTSRIVPGTVNIFHGGWYQPGEEKSPLMPGGIDLGGAPNVLTHNEYLPDTVVGFFPCKGLVQIEKWQGAAN